MSTMAGKGSRRRWGIGQILVVLVLVTLTPFILLEAARGTQDVRRSRQSVTERALGQVEEEAETMEDFVRHTERYLTTLARDPAISQLDMPAIETIFQTVRD
ncbi:MAG: hypothetical protein ACRDJ9_17820, partial [Dehalococcoidia bacterium]